MLWGTKISRSAYTLRRDGIGSVEPTHGGNLAIRIGREIAEKGPLDDRWEQVAYVVLTPQERRELAAYLAREEGVQAEGSGEQVNRAPDLHEAQADLIYGMLTQRLYLREEDEERPLVSAARDAIYPRTSTSREANEALELLREGRAS